MPQEMGLIAIAVRQTQGKGQSSFVIVPCVCFLKPDSRGPRADCWHIPTLAGLQVEAICLLAPPAPPTPQAEQGKRDGMDRRLSLYKIKAFSETEMSLNHLTSACDGFHTW